MWSQFYLVAVVIALILLVPGYLTLRAFGLPRPWALCCAPVTSVALLSIWGQLLALAHVGATPALVLVPLTLSPVIACALVRGRIRELPVPPMRPWMPALFLTCGIVLGYALYVSRIPTADTIYQSYDVTQHLNLIQAMADSGRLSSLGVSPYLSAADAAIDPTPNAAFYPASWHALCAMAVQTASTSTATAINASMFVFTSLVYPLSMCAFLTAIFRDQPRVIGFGAITALSFVVFPWALVIFGPVYPNVAGFAVMPTALALFVVLIGSEITVSQRARIGTLLVACSIGMALLHPNTIFTCAIILGPYCVSRIWDLSRTHGLSKPRTAIACAVFVLACCGAWYCAYRLPFFAATVSHVWKPYARPWQQFINIISQTYILNFWGEVAVQWVLAPLAIVGIVRALHMPGKRWIVGGYSLAAAICLYSGTQEGTLKQILAGFWYTDPMRLATICSIAAVPLAALGLDWVFGALRNVVTSYNVKLSRPTSSIRVGTVLVASFLLLNFMPSFNLPGQHYAMQPSELAANQGKELRDYTKTFHTTFGDYRANAASVYSFDAPLDRRERAFVKHAHNLVGPELILNDPMDGSFLAYGYDGLRVYYRNFVGVGDNNETANSRLIRMGLNAYATNAQVREAVKATGARYVMVLDHAGSDTSMINLRGDYDATKFAGISSITPETPGFTLVFQQGNLCLYRID